MITITHKEVQALFKNLETGNSEVFFERVSENVHWTVMGTHPLAGVYDSKDDFLKATFKRLNKILNEGVILKVNHVFVDGLTAIVEMISLSTEKDNEPFNNSYCWVVDFDNEKTITTVRAYLDSALVQQAIDDNE